LVVLAIAVYVWNNSLTANNSRQEERLNQLELQVHALAVTPTGTTTGASVLPAAGAPTARAYVDLGANPRAYASTVTVDRPGPWELAVSDGQRTARIPFVVPVQIVSPPEHLVYGGFLAAGILIQR